MRVLRVRIKLRVPGAVQGPRPGPRAQGPGPGPRPRARISLSEYFHASFKRPKNFVAQGPRAQAQGPGHRAQGLGPGPRPWTHVHGYARVQASIHIYPKGFACRPRFAFVSLPDYFPPLKRALARVCAHFRKKTRSSN